MNEDRLQFLKELGWDSFFEEHFQVMKVPGSVPARVISESKGSYQIYSQYGELTAKISAKCGTMPGQKISIPLLAIG